MNSLGTLLELQWRSLRNGVSRTSNSAIATRAGSVIVLCAAAVTGGFMAGSATPPTPGTSAVVEIAFWLGAVCASVLSFRIMENIYRTQDTRILSTWPIPLTAQFWYRFLRSALEVCALFFLCCLFLAPSLASAALSEVLAGAFLIAGGMAIGLTVGFVVQLRAGVSSFIAPRKKALGELGRMDAGGGTAAAFYISPGAALVATLTGLLLLKLSVVDELFVRGTTRLFWLGLAVPAISCAVGIWLARRDFVRYYPMLLARFYEADLIQFDSGYNYHESVTTARRGLFERLLPAQLVPLVRKDILQLGRRYPMMRLAVGGLWFTVGVAAWGDRLDALALGLLPMAYMCIVAAPWARLYSAALEPGILTTQPIAESNVHASKLLVGIREAVIAGGPSAILIGALGAPTMSITAACIALSTPMVAAVALSFLARTTSGSVSRLAGLAICAATIPVF